MNADVETPDMPRTARALPSESPENRSSSRKAAITVVLVIGALTGVLAWLLFGTDADKAFVYSKLVDEVMSAPAAWTGREVRVEGDLKAGSVLFREEPCEWRFVVAKRGREMPVRFPQCVVPDTFRDGMGVTVTVQGALGQDGTFIANQVIPRCPSKYEMKQKQARGETMPHGTPTGAHFPGR